MWPLSVVESNPRADPSPFLATVAVALQINVFVLQASLQPLDKHIVHPSAAPVHRDADAGTSQRAGEGRAGELAALVGVENLRPAEARQDLLERRQAKPAAHTV